MIFSSIAMSKQINPNVQVEGGRSTIFEYMLCFNWVIAEYTPAPFPSLGFWEFLKEVSIPSLEGTFFLHLTRVPKPRQFENRTFDVLACNPQP